MFREVGSAEILKSGTASAVTVSDMVVLWVRLLLVPVTVRV